MKERNELRKKDVIRIVSGALDQLLDLLTIYSPADILQPKTIVFEPTPNSKTDLINMYLDHREEIDFMLWKIM